MSETAYRAKLRSPVRALWAGLVDFNSFFDMFSAAIRTGLTQAWNDGLKSGGILPNEQTPEEKAALQEIIFNQFGYISRLGGDIIKGTVNPTTGERLSDRLRTNLTVYYNRLDKWTKAWQATYNKAEAMANGNRKKKFTLGATKAHCKTCLALAGKVKRNSFLLAHGILDKPDERFDCGRWGCQCDWYDTDEPVSRGPLPRGL